MARALEFDQSYYRVRHTTREEEGNISDHSPVETTWRIVRAIEIPKIAKFEILKIQKS